MYLCWECGLYVNRLQIIVVQICRFEVVIYISGLQVVQICGLQVVIDICGLQVVVQICGLKVVFLLLALAPRELWQLRLQKILPLLRRMTILIRNLIASCNHECLEKFLIFIVSIKMRMTKRRKQKLTWSC